MQQRTRTRSAGCLSHRRPWRLGRPPWRRLRARDWCQSDLSDFSGASSSVTGADTRAISASSIAVARSSTASSGASTAPRCSSSSRLSISVLLQQLVFGEQALCSELGADGGSGAVQAASNRSRRNTEHERDLGLTQLFPCHEEENLALVVGETLKGLFQLRPACLGVELLIEFGPRIAYRSRDWRCPPRGGHASERGGRCELCRRARVVRRARAWL